VREKFEIITILNSGEPPVRKRLTPEARADKRACNGSNCVRVAAAD